MSTTEDKMDKVKSNRKNVLRSSEPRKRARSSPLVVYKGHDSPYNGDSDEGGVERMDVQKYIDRLDIDRRESEKRIQLSMDSLKRELREDRQLMEQRIDQDRSSSEERMEKRFSEAMTRFDKSVDKVDSLKWWILGVCLTTILGIAAMVITVVAGG